MESERIIQEISRNRYSICSYIKAQFSSPTKPMIHQGARIALFTEGKGSIIINGNEHEVKKGTMLFILPWDTTYSSKIRKTIKADIITFSFDMVVEFVLSKNYANGMSGVINEVSQNPLIDLSDKQYDKISGIFEDIREEANDEIAILEDKEKLLIDTYTTNKLIELVLLFCRYQQHTKKDIQEDSDVLTRIFKYIYGHISTGVTLSDLSVIFYMSESSISKFIQEKTGMNFSDLVSEIRIAKSEELLIYTDLSLNDIAEIAGFSDSSHLIKSFSSRVGRSPKKYRSMYQSRGYIMKGKKRALAFEIIGYIDKHFMDNLKISDAVRHFSRTSKEINDALYYVVEKSFDELLNYLRINKACEMLLKSDVSIGVVATAVGFNNQKTFCRTFRKLKNMSPSDFRSSIAIIDSDMLTDEQDVLE